MKAAVASGVDLDTASVLVGCSRDLAANIAKIPQGISSGIRSLLRQYRLHTSVRTQVAMVGDPADFVA